MNRDDTVGRSVGTRSFEEAGCRNRFADHIKGKASAENSCHHSNCHQLVKSARDRTDNLPAITAEVYGQTPSGQIGFSCGGEVDRPQFRVAIQRVGWTSLKEADVSSRFLPGFFLVSALL